MVRRIYKQKLIHFIVTASLVLPPLTFVDAAYAAGSGGGGKCTKAITAYCQKGGSQAVNSLTNFIKTGSPTDNAANLQQATATSSAASSANADDCANMIPTICGDKSCDPQDAKACKQAGQDAASNMKAQSDSLGANSSSLSSMLPMLLGVGAMAAMMAMQKQQQQQAPPPQPTYGALQPNGGLNCAMADSYKYADCDSYLSTIACVGYGNPTTVPAGPPVTGTIVAAPGGMMAQPDCASFTQRYCSPSQVPGTAMGDVLPNGVTTQVNIAGMGEGYSTPYCQNYAATAWCNDPTFGASRQSCSACRTLVSNTGQTCSLNPQLCMAQNSSPAAADGNPACQGQPVYQPTIPIGTVTAGNAASANGGSGAIQAVASGGPATGSGLSNSGPTVATTLPQSVGANSAAALAGIKRAGALRASGQAAREGAGNGEGVHPGSVNSDYLAAAGGVILPRSASVSRGPASDVQGPYGPSLFAMGTQVYRQRCQAHQFNNCP